MNAEIISIGSEITTGSILNTNAQYIAEQLLELGIESPYHTAVDDNAGRLRKIINIAINRADLIITTGGLGPTEDDLTKEIFAEVLNLNLIKDQNMIDVIRDKFKSYNRTQVMPTNNIKQGIKLEGSDFLQNYIGTAPGIFLSKDKKIIIMLPGPPEEMKSMFYHEVKPLIHKDFHIIKKSINLSGIGESTVEMKIKDLINIKPNVNIATFAKIEEVEIQVIGKGINILEVEKDIDYIVGILKDRFEKNIYALNNTPIEEIVFSILKQRGYKIGFCESCTGGLVSGRFSQIPGVSKVLDRSIVTYSNDAKIEEVKVNPMTLNKYGAVSKEVALEMAQGMLSHGGLDIALSITGIAGPLSESDIKPVGLVYIGIATSSSTSISKFKLTGSRKLIQKKAVNKAFFELRNFLLNN